MRRNALQRCWRVSRARAARRALMRSCCRGSAARSAQVHLLCCSLAHYDIGRSVLLPLTSRLHARLAVAAGDYQQQVTIRPVCPHAERCRAAGVVPISSALYEQLCAAAAGRSAPSSSSGNSANGSGSSRNGAVQTHARGPALAGRNGAAVASPALPPPSPSGACLVNLVLPSIFACFLVSMHAYTLHSHCVISLNSRAQAVLGHPKSQPICSLVLHFRRREASRAQHCYEATAPAKGHG